MAASMVSSGAAMRQFRQSGVSPSGRSQCSAAARHSPVSWLTYISDSSISASMSSRSFQTPKAMRELVSPDESPMATSGFIPRMFRVRRVWAWQTKEEPVSWVAGEKPVISSP